MASSLFAQKRNAELPATCCQCGVQEKVAHIKFGFPTESSESSFDDVTDMQNMQFNHTKPAMVQVNMFSDDID